MGGPVSPTAGGSGGQAPRRVSLASHASRLGSALGCADRARLEGLEGAWLGGSLSLTGSNLGPGNLIPALALPF